MLGSLWPSFRVGSFVAWHGLNKGLGREGPKRLGDLAHLSKENHNLGHHIFSLCSTYPQKPSLEFVCIEGF